MLTFCSTTSLLPQLTSTDVALRMDYYNFMIDLRNEVRDYLESIEIQMKSIVQQLQYFGRYRIANERRLQFQQTYDRLSLAFDRGFEAVDRMFVMKGAQLTDTNAPTAQKQFLVKTAMQDARAAVDHVIRRSEIRRLNLIRRAIGARSSAAYIGATQGHSPNFPRAHSTTICQH